MTTPHSPERRAQIAAALKDRWATDRAFMMDRQSKIEWIPEMMDQFWADWHAGLTIKQSAKNIGVSTMTLWKKRQQYGLKCYKPDNLTVAQRYWQKLTADPIRHAVYKARHLEQKKRWFEENIKSDPVKYEAYKAACRAAYHKRKSKSS